MRYLIACFLFLATTQLGASENLDKLIQGNSRFAQQNTIRKELITAQYPFCAVLACADSRVAPEIIFDQNIGDLFVVRLAGNVAGPEVLDSLDFACNVLGVKLIVVMGHQNCGAVNAVMQHKGDKELGAIASLIAPAVEGATTLDQAIANNVKEQIKNVRASQDLQKGLQTGAIEIVGAVYNFETGAVTFLK